MTANGVTYQLTQTLTNRRESTYENVLTINQQVADIVDSIFTCTVANVLGTSITSQPITITSEIRSLGSSHGQTI